MSTPGNSDKRLMRIAYHEAGHAVIAHYFGFDVKSATIEPSIDKADQEITGRVDIDNREGEESDDLTALVRRLIVTTAGHQAEAEYLGVPDLSDRDVYYNFLEFRKTQQRCERIVELFGLPVDSHEVSDSEKALHQFARTASRQLLKSRWRIVEAVSRTLLDRKTLTATEIKELCEPDGDKRA